MMNFSNVTIVNIFFHKTFLFQLSLVAILFIAATVSSYAQVKDTVAPTVTETPTVTGALADTVKHDTLVKHSPKKAALMSTILPGLGQIYNKKYWKTALIYAGFGGLGYAFALTQTRYVDYRDAYKYRIDGDNSTIDKYNGIYADATLFDLQAKYNRSRDLSMIGLGLLYVLNIVDATVDAHLFYFDVSDNLSLNIQPTFIKTTAATHYQLGVSTTIKF